MVYLPAVGVRLLWVSKTVLPDNTTAVMVWLAGTVDMPSSDVNWTVLGNFWAGALFTVMVTVATVELFPALSRD